MYRIKKADEYLADFVRAENETPINELIREVGNADDSLDIRSFDDVVKNYGISNSPNHNRSNQQSD